MEVLQVVRIIVLAIVCISLVAGFLYLRRHDTRRYAMASAVAAPGWGALGAINVAQGDFLLAALTLVLVAFSSTTLAPAGNRWGVFCPYLARISLKNSSSFVSSARIPSGMFE